MNGEKKFCEDCKFFQSFLNSNMGECRRKSPRAIYLKNREDVVPSVWPVVKAEDWCGEYVKDEEPYVP